MSGLASADRRRVEEIAAHWVMRRDDPDWRSEDQAELDAWLDESMAHKAAFWRLEHGWRQADRLGSLGAAVMPNSRRAPTSWTDRAWRPMALAASIALAFVTLAYVRSPSSPMPAEPARQTFVTTVGGHKRVPLQDGTQIELNTATVLRAAVTPDSRQVWLESGEAYFEVKHSDRIPFVVYAGARTVTVLGTKFSVRRDGDKVTVSVVEGKVRVNETGAAPSSRDASVASSATVTAGAIAFADGKSTLVATRSLQRVENALAWRDGMLSFDRTSLADVAAEFNRYNDRKLVIADPGVAAIRIGGTFQASNVDAFSRLLRDAYGLRVAAGEREIKISD